jgi:shikimate dehydrogenase
MATGAARSGARRVILFNRTLERARALAQGLAPHYPDVAFEPQGDPALLARWAEEADLIANATSLGMRPEDPMPLPEDAIQARHVVYDSIYSPAETALVLAARRRGARAAGGQGMLARQGALSLSIWAGGPNRLQSIEELMLDVLRRRLAR